MKQVDARLVLEAISLQLSESEVEEEDINAARQATENESSQN